MIKTILKTIPQFSDIPLSDLKLQKLSGLTNTNYLVTPSTGSIQKFILRIPRKETNSFINRKNESHNSTIAEQLNIAPKNVWREKSGISLTKYLENAITPNINNPQTLEKVANTLTTLHRSKKKFKGSLDNKKITKLLTQYFALCSKVQQRSLEPNYQKTLSLLKSPLSKRPAVPSHIDLVLENILQQNDKVWFIDWEYSAMASPFWDIATLCHSEQLDSAKSTELLTKVLIDCQLSDIEHLKQYRFIVKTFSDCWQSAFNN